MTGHAPLPRVRRYALLRSREYVTLLLSHVVSLIGDQLARVALTLLVYERTGSPLLSAVVYAATFLPAVLGGPLLGGLADRLPRRRLLVGCDLARAGLFGLMALPGLPLAGLLALLVLAVSLEGPWGAARVPLMREVLEDDDLYQRGIGLDQVLLQSGQIVGFAAAGLLLAVVDPKVALVLDALSFLVSAAMTRFGLRSRPAAEQERPVLRRRRDALRTGVCDARRGWRAALSPQCRLPLLLTWATLTAAIAPEALATPWAASLGAGARGTGLLYAAGPAGTALAVLAVSHVPVDRSRRLLGPLALLSVLPLIACALQPSLPMAVLLVAVSGTGASCSLLARVAFIRAVDPLAAGRAFSIAAAGVTGLQGLGIAGAGLVAAVLRPGQAVGVVGAVGTVLVALVLLTCRREGAAVPVSRPEGARTAAA